MSELIELQDKCFDEFQNIEFDYDDMFFDMYKRNKDICVHYHNGQNKPPLYNNVLTNL